MSKRLQAPKALSVQMDITTRCNLRCIMCAREQYDPQAYDMPVEVFEVIARKVFDKAAVLNLSCGAEPLMSRHFDQIMAIVQGYHIPWVELVTNGTLLDEHRIRTLIECGVKSIQVSMTARAKRPMNGSGGEPISTA